MFILLAIIAVLLIIIYMQYRQIIEHEDHINTLLNKRDLFPSPSIRLVSSGSISENDNHYRLDENYMRNRG